MENLTAKIVKNWLSSSIVIIIIIMPMLNKCFILNSNQKVNVAYILQQNVPDMSVYTWNYIQYMSTMVS